MSTSPSNQSKVLDVLSNFNTTTKSLSQADFDKAKENFIADIQSPVSGLSGGSFWNALVAKASSLGFSLVNETSTISTNSSSLTTDSNFPAPFDSEGGKKHLVALSALIGLPQSYVKELTEHVFENIAADKKANGLDEDKENMHSLLGTKDLFLRVRNYHYSQQIDRIRIIRESLRIEYTDEEEMSGNKNAMRDLCISFLKSIDEKISWSSSSRNDQSPNARGLFQMLLSLACATFKTIGREEIFRACELTDGPDASERKSGPVGDFGRKLLADHKLHHDVVIRSEALDSLFMLLYQKVEGGIDRTDYILLLIAMECQDFFVANEDFSLDDSKKIEKKQSKIASLIVAECTGLWSTMVEDSKVDWFSSHPILCDSPSVMNEIEAISDYLLNNLKSKVFERRRIYFSQNQEMIKSFDDDKIDTPESIAILTFGLLLKLCHSSSQDGGWAKHLKVRGMAVECVSVANDDCGAFGYLGSIMTHLISSPFPTATSFDTSLNSFFSGIQDIHRDLTVLSIEEGTKEIEEDSESVIYASIAREILVTTLAAFRSSISRSLSPTKVDNLGMLCQLAAKLHRNSNSLCFRFWSEWDSTPQDLNLTDVGAISVEKADPLVLLLDVAHSVATSAIDSISSRTLEGDSMISVDCGRDEALILPCLAPLLGFLASLLPTKPDDIQTILSNFLPPIVIEISLLGIYHVVSKENFSSSDSDEMKREVDAAKHCMEALCILSTIASSESSGECTEWLRQSTHSSKYQIGGPALLHGIAIMAYQNSALEKSVSTEITSNALDCISYLCQHSQDDFDWAYKVGQSFSSVRNDSYRTFAVHINKVTTSFLSLLSQLIHSVAKATMSTDDSFLEHNIAFMKEISQGAFLACDIIASSSQSYELSIEHSNILKNSFKVLTSCTYVMNAISQYHSNETIKAEASTIRDSIIDSIADSTAVGSNIGFYSTFIISQRYAEVLEFRSRMAVSESKGLFMQGKKSELESEVLENLTIPEHDKLGSMVELSREALRLLKAWNDVTEQLTLESIGVEHTSSFADLDMDKISHEQQKNFDLTAYSRGPVRLFLSSAPIQSSQQLSASYLSLLTKFVSWQNDFKDLALISLDLLSSTIVQAKLDSNPDFLPLLDYSSSSIGVIIHNALYSMVNDGPIQSNEITVFVKLLNVICLATRCTPILCKTILNKSSDSKELLQSLEGMVCSTIPTPMKDCMRLATLLQSIYKLLDAVYKVSDDTSYRSSFTSSHPCLEIAESLLENGSLVQKCTSICNNLNPVLRQDIGNGPEHLHNLHQNAYTFAIFQYALKIIELDETRSKTSKYSKHIDRLNDVKMWFTALNEGRAALVNAEATKEALQLLDNENIVISSSESYKSNSMKYLLSHIESAQRQLIIRSLEISAASRGSLHSSLSVLQHVSEFVIMLLPQIETEVGKTALVNLAIDNLNNLTQCLSTSFTECNISISQSLLDLLMTSASNILVFTSASISDASHADLNQDVILNNLDKILKSVERLLIIDTASDSKSSLNLRLNTLISTLPLLNVLNEIDLNEEGEESARSIKAGLVRFSSLSLNHLLHQNHEGSCSTKQQQQKTKEKSKLTLVSALSILSRVVLSCDHRKSMHAFQSFAMDLADIMRTTNLLESLSRHLDRSSKASALLFVSKTRGKIHDPAFEITQSILSFALILSESKETAFTDIMSKGSLIQLVLKNDLITTSCQCWTVPNASLKSSLENRGYFDDIVSTTATLSSKSLRYNYIPDPAHSVWRTTIRVLSAMLHSTSVENSETRERVSSLAVDFLHYYEIPLTSFIEKCLNQAPDNKENSNSSSPSSGFGFTIATFAELSDIMSFVSELCSGEHKKYFECISPRLYGIMSNAAIAICRSLSSFLGALGTARELFQALTKLDEIMTSDMSQNPAAAKQYQNFSAHPLLADGVPNAKHQAIRNALYASSCCRCMTHEEYSLSLRGRPESNGNNEDLEHSFHSHVSNDFIYHMEEIASQCILGALSVVHKVHPTTSAFVSFSKQEAATLNLSTSPPLGAMVAIRQDVDSSIPNDTENIRYGRVIHYNQINKKMNVEYFDNQGVSAERDIDMYRLAMLEDTSKRVNLFQYKPAPESVSDSPSSNFTGPASIGNLILILRWCREHSQHPEIITKRTSLELKGIANLASVILGNEIGIHVELDTPRFTPEQEKKVINVQLLSLFDEEIKLQGFDLAASSGSSNNEKSLQGLINDKVWRNIQLQLESSLITARVEKEVAKKNSEQAGTETQYWGRRTPTNASSRIHRRSPFS